MALSRITHELRRNQRNHGSRSVTMAAVFIYGHITQSTALRVVFTNPTRQRGESRFILAGASG